MKTTNSIEEFQRLNSKPKHYYEGIRADFVGQLPRNPTGRILEVGCSFGGTGALALSEGRCGSYHAIEIDHASAKKAGEVLTEVLQLDVEALEDMPWPRQHFDVLIMSEVIEHLREPLVTLKKLGELVKNGGILLCSSPNVSHYHFLGRIWNQKWDLEPSGIMDETHLQWFTPKSYRVLVEEAGFEVQRVGPVKPFDSWDYFRGFICGGRMHLFMKQIQIFAVRK